MNIKSLRKKFFRNHSFNKWFGFGVMLIFLFITIYSNNYMVKQLRAEEQKNVEIIVNALEVVSSNEELNDASRAFALKIIEGNKRIPLILINENQEFSLQRNLDNIESKLIHDSAFLNRKLQSMAKEHEPIQVNLPFGTQKIYFENSFLLSQLEYYPLLLFIILLVFCLFTVWYFRTIEISRNGFLWAGMAKETAHQIGTPLSSLLGWVELLKMENLSDVIVVDEMEKDIKRLNQIAVRFSQIGSEPELKKQNIVSCSLESINYLKKRISSQIEIVFKAQQDVIYAEFNKELLSWVIENLVKNAVDAMCNKGVITFSIIYSSKNVILTIKDTGRGITSKQKKNIFEPGFTTKERGWGLGLTLTKRIIEDYHSGKISVMKSNAKGTTFQIILPQKKPQKLGFKKKFKRLLKI